MKGRTTITVDVEAVSCGR